MKKAWSRKNLWDKSPAWVKRSAGAVFARVPLPWILGPTFRSTLKSLEESQFWSPEQIREYQTLRLRWLLLKAKEHSSYYQSIFNACGFDPESLSTPEDIRRLPTMDRNTVKENLDDLLTVPRESSQIDFVSTGGTGGEPLYFYAPSSRSAVEYAYLLSSWKRIGYRPSLPMVVLRGKIVEPDGTGLRHAYDPLLKHHCYSNFHVNDVNLARYVEHIGSLGNCYLHAYPSSAEAMGRFIRRTKARAPANIKGIILESENLSLEQTDFLEEVFGCRVLSCYGHSEKLVLAAQCEHGHDYHVWPTYGYFELLDSDGGPITEIGQRGEIVGTGLINTVTPMIRYRTGDFATLRGFSCDDCGRSHVRLGPIEGRWPAGSLVAEDGSEVTMTALNLHDDSLTGMVRYRFFQDTPGKALLKVQPAEPPHAEVLKKIQANLNARTAGRVEISVQVVDDIPLTKVGKCELVEQRIKAT